MALPPRKYRLPISDGRVVVAAITLAIVVMVGLGLALAWVLPGRGPGAASRLPAATPPVYRAVPMQFGTPPPLTPVVAGPESLVISVEGVQGAQGSSLIVVVSLGLPPQGIGGFSVAVDADPFSVTATVREGTPLPWVLPTPGAPGQPPLGYLPGSRPAARVPDGTYMLYVYVASRVDPYSEWVPVNTVEQRCEGRFAVDAASRHVRVTGVAAAGPPFQHPTPACLFRGPG